MDDAGVYPLRHGQWRAVRLAQRQKPSGVRGAFESVEIYSNRPNMAVLHHHRRKSPGFLLQGDTRHALCAQVADALAGGPDASEELKDVHSKLPSMLAHYTSVLSEHQLDIPFSRPTGA
ncbi:DUF6959 family protein [Xanthomonas arboricola]